jgi:hypothetical protein
MNSELLSVLYHRLFGDPTFTQTPGCTFGDAIILLIHFFAALNNHSHRWAYDKKNWPLWCRRLKFPSYSQLMKRLALQSTQDRIAQLNQEYRQHLPCGNEKICDGKPLVVGGYSKDKDSKGGKIPNGWGRGYKLHVLIDAICGVILAFRITALNDGESTVMCSLVSELDLHDSQVRSDSNYDSNELYKAIADRGGQLIAPRKKPGRGLGHHKQHPHRLAAIEELEGDPQHLKAHKLQRNGVEQRLAHLTNLPCCDLWGLPNHVRHLTRVSRWVSTKIMLYHLYKYLALSKPSAAAA